MTTPPRWNLDDLFASPEDPRLTALLETLHADAEAFAQRYRGQLHQQTPAQMAETLAAYERIRQEATKPLTYAQLRFAADACPENGALLQKLRERTTTATLPLLFFDIEMVTLSVKQLEEFAADPALANYAHFLNCLRAQAPFRLSEPEERVLEEMANTGRRAFVRLFEELQSSLRILVDGAECTLSEALARQSDTDRGVRERAASALSAALDERLRTVVFLYNTIAQNHATENRLRGYGTPEHSRHLANELSPEVVEQVVQTAEAGYALVGRYYRAKRRALGLAQLMHFDRYAPLRTETTPVPYADACVSIQEAFDAFDPDFAAAGRTLLTSPWIDAEPRKGKRGGAFCNYATPDLHPYLLMTYLGKLGDIKTLAHELGHGIHSYLSRNQSFVNYHGTLPMAEVASTFAEMLVVDTQERHLDGAARQALLGHQIEQSCATIFRQTAMYRFEQAVHAERAEGELTAQRLGQIWQEKLGAMFDGSVHLGDEHANWWSYIPHFQASPFYVYAYTFGEMLALALVHRYRQEGPAFARRYVAMLRAGGSRSPQELAASLGVELNDTAFWRGALTVLETQVTNFETQVSTR